jgi:hypothetical protein
MDLAAEAREAASAALDASLKKGLTAELRRTLKAKDVSFREQAEAEVARAQVSDCRARRMVAARPCRE